MGRYVEVLRREGGRKRGRGEEGKEGRKGRRRERGRKGLVGCVFNAHEDKNR